MPEAANHQAVQVGSPVLCSGSLLQRDPALFSGTDDHDPEDWLTSYERVSTYNKWDDTTKLNNVIFYLTGVANLWFRNHEADFSTWTTFKANLTEVFGRPAVLKLRAEQRLRERSQQSGETFTSYTEDVVNLCSRVNAQLSEADNIKHILKGIEDDAFQMLPSRDLRPVAEVVSLCQSYDELRKQRLITRQHAAASVESLAGLSAAPDHSQLWAHIKDIVREEVARQLSLLPSPSMQSPFLAPELRTAISEQVAEALPPVPPPAPGQPPAPVAAPLTYAAAVAQPRPPNYRPTYAPRQAVPTFEMIYEQTWLGVGTLSGNELRRADLFQEAIVADGVLWGRFDGSA
ncbi:uncharacterized protein LOC144095556 [Amblyomma americanum]